MGASAISIQAAIAAVVLLAIVALFISPFSAIFVIAAGVLFVAFLAIWGRRAQQGEVGAEGADPPARRTGDVGSGSPTAGVDRAGGAER